MSEGNGTPGVGVYHDVPFEEYLSWDALNISTLLWGRLSMEHVRAALDGVIEEKTSPAMLFGSALHCRLLEPSRFGERYSVASGCQGIMKSGKRAGEECGGKASFRVGEGEGARYYCARHAPKSAVEADDVLSAEDAAHIEAINVKVREHPVVKLIRQHGGFEASIVFEKEDILCKARLDKWITGGTAPDTIVDLKKTRLGGASDDQFSRAVDNYHYHQKAAWYCEAAQAISGISPAFVWIAVEEVPPYGINVIHCDAETLRIGQYLNETLFANYVVATESGDWAGYAKDIHEGGLPGYRRREFQGLV